MGSVSCTEVCELVSDIVCVDCEKRGDCLLSEEKPADEFHEQLMECLQTYIGRLRENAREKVTFT